MIDNSKNNYDEIFNNVSDYDNLEDEDFDYLNNHTEYYLQNIEEEYSYMDMNQEDSDDDYERHLAELAIEEQAITNFNNLPAPDIENLHTLKPLHLTREV